MNLKKLLLLPIGLVVSAAGCAGIGPNATYYMATTSFLYDLSYNSYNVNLNGKEIGGGFGGARTTTEVRLGTQEIKWEESNSKKQHQAKNQVTLTKDDLKGMKYLAVHIYPDDTIEIKTSNNLPDPTDKGLKWREQIRKTIQK